MNTDKTEVKVKLLKFFEMNHQRPDEVVSLTMPNYGLWQTAAVRNPDDDSKRAYDLVCVMPYHKHRKAGDKITVYQWVIDECMHEIIFKRAASTPQPTAEGQRLSAEEILKDELQKGNPLNYELTRRQTLNHFWDKIIAAMYRFTAQHHNKGEKSMFKLPDYDKGYTDGVGDMRRDIAEGKWNKTIEKVIQQGECEKVSKWPNILELQKLIYSIIRNHMCNEKDAEALTDDEILERFEHEFIICDRAICEVLGLVQRRVVTATPSPITKEQIEKVLVDTLPIAVHEVGPWKVRVENSSAQATAILNLIQGGEREGFYSKILGMDTPLPLQDVLAKLIDAADILLHKHDYDGHSHEEILYALNRAKEIYKHLTADTALTEAENTLKNPATVEQAKAQVERLKGERYTCCDEGTCEECGAFIPHATGLCGECISKPSNH